MKVKELIQKLSEYPQNTTVLCFNKGENEYIIDDIIPTASCISKEHYVVGVMLKEAENDEKTSKDDFNAEIIKLYYDDTKKATYKAERAIEAFKEILYNNNCGDFWTDFSTSNDVLIRQWDIVCSMFASKRCN